MTESVYLDYNATAPVRPAAADAVAQALSLTGNPSSVHGPGRAARQLLEEARSEVAQLVGAEPADVVFTSGGTEANSLALAGAGRQRILVSAGEHDSVLQAAPMAKRIPLTAQGQVDLKALDEQSAAAEEPALVSVMLANNETGVIQPVEEVVSLAKKHGALVHCDAVQAAGKIGIDFAGLGVDLMSLSAHKIGGPAGIGALVLRPGLELKAQQRGGGQERSRRAGTENLPGAAGFGAAAGAAAAELADFAVLTAERDRMEKGLRELAPGVQIFGAAGPRLPNTSCFAFEGLESALQVMALDLAGVAVSAGAACSSGKVQPSHVLEAMGAPPALAGTAIRVSLGWASTAGDVDLFLAAWGDLLRRQGPQPDAKAGA